MLAMALQFGGNAKEAQEVYMLDLRALDQQVRCVWHQGYAIRERCNTARFSAAIASTVSELWTAY